MLVRTWNIAHGSTKPPSRRRHVREAVELVTADLPTIVCVQEVPARALKRLEEWSPMHAVPARTRRGEGNAILVAPEVRVRETRIVTLNTNPFVEEHGRELGLDTKAMRCWERERRVCHLVKLEFPNRWRVLVATLRLTLDSDPRLAEAEFARATNFVEKAAELEETVVVAGEWREPLRITNGRVLASRVWEEDERMYGGRALSMHPPVEADVQPER